MKWTYRRESSNNRNMRSNFFWGYFQNSRSSYLPLGGHWGGLRVLRRFCSHPICPGGPYHCIEEREFLYPYDRAPWNLGLGRANFVLARKVVPLSVEEMDVVGCNRWVRVGHISDGKNDIFGMSEGFQMSPAGGDSLDRVVLPHERLNRDCWIVSICEPGGVAADYPWIHTVWFARKMKTIDPMRRHESVWEFVGSRIPRQRYWIWGYLYAHSTALDIPNLHRSMGENDNAPPAPKRETNGCWSKQSWWPSLIAIPE